MLAEEDYAVVSRLYADVVKPGQRLTIDARCKPVCDERKRMTGTADRHEKAIMHPRISLSGPPRVHGGKPLRTPHASCCTACGAPVTLGETGSR